MSNICDYIYNMILFLLRFTIVSISQTCYCAFTFIKAKGTSSKHYFYKMVLQNDAFFRTARCGLMETPSQGWGTSTCFTQKGMNKMNKLTLQVLDQACANNGIAIRCRRRLQPAGGSGSKLFPPSYEKGKYATEKRKIDGEDRDCVLLDSVQSQANRIEQALKSAYYKPGEEKAGIPIIAVDFASAGLPEIGYLTSMDAPHRIADAILRDSLLDGKKFRDSDIGKAFTEATAQKANALFESCPTALLLGMWDSTGPKGGLGSKFQRALVSEIVGINTATGVKIRSRIDPLNISAGVTIYHAENQDDANCIWVVDENKAEMKNGKPVLFDKGGESGKPGNPSKANHGNVTPSLEDGKGGVTVDYALQTTVISLAALRRLHFPTDTGDADNAARTALAALGICGAVLAQSDSDLRSRCLLVPEEAACWEIIAADGNVESYEINAGLAKELLAAATEQVKEAGLPWNTDVVVLQPSAPLTELVKRSRAIQAAQPAEG